MERERGSRTERKRADRMAQIERTAARVFAEKGYDRANLDEIAADLDLRGSSLYHYFPSKDELYRRCLDGSADLVFERLQAIIAAEPDPACALEALLREQILVETRDFPEFVPLFYGAPVPVPDLRAEVLGLRRRHAAIFEGVAQRLAETRGLTTADLRIWLGVTFGALAYLHQWYRPSGTLGPEEVADRMATTLMGSFPGLAASSRTTS